VAFDDLWPQNPRIIKNFCLLQKSSGDDLFFPENISAHLAPAGLKQQYLQQVDRKEIFVLSPAAWQRYTYVNLPKAETAKPRQIAIN